MRVWVRFLALVVVLSLLTGACGGASVLGPDDSDAVTATTGGGTVTDANVADTTAVLEFPLVFQGFGSVDIEASTQFGIQGSVTSESIAEVEIVLQADGSAIGTVTYRQSVNWNCGDDDQRGNVESIDTDFVDDLEGTHDGTGTFSLDHALGDLSGTYDAESLSGHQLLVSDREPDDDCGARHYVRELTFEQIHRVDGDPGIAASTGAESSLDTLESLDDLYALEFDLGVIARDEVDDAHTELNVALGELTDAYANAVLRTFLFDLTSFDAVGADEWDRVGSETLAAWMRFDAVRTAFGERVDALPDSSASSLRSIRLAKEQSGACEIIRPGDPAIENEIAALTPHQRLEVLRSDADCRWGHLQADIRATEGATPEQIATHVRHSLGLTDEKLIAQLVQERISQYNTKRVFAKVAENTLGAGLSVITGDAEGVVVSITDATMSIAYSTPDHPGRRVINIHGDVNAILSWKETLIKKGAVTLITGLAGTRERLGDEHGVTLYIDDDGNLSGSIKPAEPQDLSPEYVTTTKTGGLIDLSGACPTRQIQQWRQTLCPAEQVILDTEGRLQGTFPLATYLELLQSLAAPTVEAFAGTYVGVIPVESQAYGRIGELPFEVIVADDGSFTVTYGGSITSTIGMTTVVYESSAVCSGTVDEFGYLDCTGTVDSTATVAGTPVSNVDSWGAEGQITGDVLRATLWGTGYDGLEVTAYRQ